MARTSAQASVPLPFEIDHDLEQAKAFVRLRQAAVPVPEAFFTLRIGASILQLLGGAIVALSLGVAIVFGLSDLAERTLAIPGYYLSVVSLLVGGGFGLFVLITGELLTLQVVIARNTRLTTVILSEMNFAEASARGELAERLALRVTPDSTPATSPIPPPPDPPAQAAEPMPSATDESDA